MQVTYNQPDDVVIWDVGHQSYAHKLLTGRYSSFSTLRQFNGICGFPKRDESPYDHFGTGHASTSISAALGFAKARDLNRTSEQVVAVIGDGALTGGLAWEALNNAANLKTNVTVVLNDNEMSISRNVGALATHLSTLRMLPLYRKVENKAKTVIQNFPVGGKTLSRTAEGIMHGVTHLIAAQTGIVFEELGFTYLGPVDGHDIDRLIEVFRSVKQMEGPVLVHILTTKGKGYELAENNARKFHGVSPFRIESGEAERKNTGRVSYTEVFSDTLVQCAADDPKIVAITAAMPDGTGLVKFGQKYPGRFFDVGIAEGHAVTFAAGLAANGLRPVVALYSTFLQRAFDHVMHDVSLQNLPVLFAIDRAGLVGDDGPTHHGVFDLSFMREAPGMVIAAPADGEELKHMLRLGLKHCGPYTVRYPRGFTPEPAVHSEPRSFEIGEGEVLIDGEDVCIMAVGTGVGISIRAIDILRESGISPALINARWVKPLDKELILKYAKRCKKLVLVEENSTIGGFGSAVMELLSAEGLSNIAVKQVGIPDEFVQHGAKSVLCELIGFDPEHIARVAADLVAFSMTPDDADGIQKEDQKTKA
jgi:1-deoxy-D-xylulose-5-phosphate synthase